MGKIRRGALNPNKPLVGVTGSIGSGKSTAAQIFTRFGGAVFNADLEAKTITQQPEILQTLQSLFGGDIVAPNRELNRSRLAERVFQNPEQLQQLNQIIHPLVRQKMWQFVKENQRNPAVRLIVIDAPLIYETDLHSWLDFIVVVAATTQRCIDRVAKRSGLNRAEILRRMKNQKPISEKIARADFVVYNNRSVEEMARMIGVIVEKILTKWRKQ